MQMCSNIHDCMYVGMKQHGQHPKAPLKWVLYSVIYCDAVLVLIPTAPSLYLVVCSLTTYVV